METFETLDPSPFKNLVMSIGALPSSFTASMSYYEALAWLVKYLETEVIPVVNNNSEVSRELQEQFVILKTYVETYFDNLDVQEEINNKLDEMVEDGTFQEIVGNLLDNKLDYYEITDQSESDFQNILNSTRAKIIVLKNDYTLTSTVHINSNTTINLNGYNLIFDIPTVVEDWEASHGFFNFYPTDVFTKYSGNSNITIKNGKITGGNLSFCHARNITVSNVTFDYCKNNHILEMCSISGLVVENCIFNGIPVGANGEYIQFENCTRSAFPFFDSSDNASYDNTPSENITINQCKFVDPDSVDYHFYAGCGTHAGSLGDDPTMNIKISQCLFKDAEAYSVQIYRGNNVEIMDCDFDSNATTESTIHVRLRNGIENCSVTGSSFKGMIRAIQTAREYGDMKNISISDNTFEGYNSTDYAGHGIVEIYDPITLNINNNIFRDFVQHAILTLASESYNPAITHTVKISNNYFVPLHIATMAVTRLRAGQCYFDNNNIDTTGYIPSDQLVNCSTEVDSFEASGNIFSGNAEATFRTIYDNKDGFANVYGVTKLLYSGNATSATITTAGTGYDPTNFNTIRMTLGGGTWTQIITLKPYELKGKFDTGRTFKFMTINNGTTATVGTLEINADKELVYNATSATLRKVVFCNE